MNIDELQAGRELDALIAEKVMGWRKLQSRGNRGMISQCGRWMIPNGATTFDLPDYSENGGLALSEVIPQIERLNLFLSWKLEKDRYGYKFSISYIGLGKWYFAAGKTPELAICRAALKAVENST